MPQNTGGFLQQFVGMLSSSELCNVFYHLSKTRVVLFFLTFSMLLSTIPNTTHSELAKANCPHIGYFEQQRRFRCRALDYIRSALPRGGASRSHQSFDSKWWYSAYYVSNVTFFSYPMFQMFKFCLASKLLKFQARKTSPCPSWEMDPDLLHIDSVDFALHNYFLEEDH